MGLGRGECWATIFLSSYLRLRGWMSDFYSLSTVRAASFLGTALALSFLGAGFAAGPGRCPAFWDFRSRRRQSCLDRCLRFPSRLCGWVRFRASAFRCCLSGIRIHSYRAFRLPARCCLVGLTRTCRYGAFVVLSTSCHTTAPRTRRLPTDCLSSERSAGLGRNRRTAELRGLPSLLG